MPLGMLRVHFIKSYLTKIAQHTHDLRHTIRVCYNSDHMTAQNRFIRIIVGIDMRHPSARAQISGILRYATKKPDWDIQILGGHPSNDSLNDDPAWTPDGLILDEFHMQRYGKRLLRLHSVRGLICMGFHPPRNVSVLNSQIIVNEREIGCGAAQLLLRHGLKNFAFVGTRRDESWSVARMRFFKAALKDKGHSVNIYHPPRQQSKDRKALAEWLKRLPRPSGVFVAFDQRAKYVVDLCRETGILVPEHLQVIGVDNDETICENTRPSLTSIAPNFDAHGYAAAAELDALLGGNTHPSHKIKTHIREIVERLSTTDLTNSASRIERAREYIRLHACDGINVIAVSTAVGGSLRLLERHFRKITGTTICEEINRVRLAKADELLTKTSLTFDDIARRSGFSNTNHLRNLFKAEFGKTLSDRRAEGRG